MKKLLSILFILCTLCVNATTYYVSSSTGNDGNNGTTTSTPWKSIAFLNTKLPALLSGDHVLFNRGDTFSGCIKPTKSFAAGNPLIFGAYGTGAKPIITGFSSITGWSDMGDGIWESILAVSTLNDVNLVVINGVNTAMGRFPNTGYLTYQGHSGTTSITSTSLNSAGINWTGADLVMKSNNFVITRGAITAHSGQTVNYITSNPDALIDGYGFFIENDVRTLDAQNEWYYNPSTKKLRIYSIGMPSGVQVSTLDTLVYMANRDNITFDGLSFTGSNRRAFYLASCDNITIQNCDFNYHGLYAIWGGSNSSSTSLNFNCNHNTFNHINSQAIYLQSQYVEPYIGYNSFKNCGVLPGMFKVPANPVTLWGGAYGSIKAVRCVGLHVEYNDIDSTGYAGIWWNPAGPDDHVLINNNAVAHHCMILMDGGGIYTWVATTFTASSNTRIINNIVHDGVGDNAGTTNTGQQLVHGIYCDDNTGGLHIEGNTCFNNPLSGIYVHSNHNSNFRGNTLFNNGKEQILISSFDYAIRNDTLINNILFSKTATQIIVNFSSKLNDASSFFNICDSNYYTRPILETYSGSGSTAPFEIAMSNGTTFFHYNLSQWKTFISPKDVNANKATKTVPSIDSIRFEYNTTASSKIVTLDANYIDVKGAAYNGTITLAPYASAVLIYNSALAGNISPVANAGTDSTITLPRDSVHLLGSGSDADGTIASYAWVKVSGRGSTTILNPNNQNVVASNLLAGTYIFRLRVTDNLGATDDDSVTVVVNPANIPPSANAGADQSITLPTNTATLSGSGTDTDGTISSYKWIQISGPNTAGITSSTSASTGTTGLIQGTYVFQLTVKDNSGDSASDITQVIVNPAGNVAPTADAGVDQFISASSTTLFGSGADTDGTIASYGWTRISGPNTPTIVSASSATTSLTGMINGVYVFMLTVTDNMGGTATDNVQVTVNMTPPTIDLIILHGKLKLQ